MRRREDPVPAFLAVDVEPDGFQVSRDTPRPWGGFAALHDAFVRLRARLERATGRRPAFGWYVRSDPQVAEVFGRADAGWRAFPERIDALREAGDHFGVHAHPVRWSETARTWVHDLDPAWLRRCTHAALDAFEAATGSPARLFRQGGSLLTNEVVEALDERGVALETSLEPCRGTNASAAVEIPSGTDASPIEGALTDCREAPRVPYRPDPRDFRRAGGPDARRIGLVPVTTGPRRLPPSPWAARAARLWGRAPKKRGTYVYYPSGAWGGPRRFWDLVDAELDRRERPYLSLGVRTDAPGCALALRVRALLEALPAHPVAARLEFTSPLEARDRLLPPVREAARR